MTAHFTFIGVNDNNELIHMNYSNEHLSSLVSIDDCAEIKAGPMVGFKVLKGSVTRFIKGGFFLCAEPGNNIISNRKNPSVWEAFTLIHPDELAQLLLKKRDVDSEIKRFNERISNLLSNNSVVKIYAGCGPVPRSGFINLDIEILAPNFMLKHPDDYFIFPYADFGWGIPNNCIDYIFDEDFIEHISQLQQIQYLSETWRVLKHGCYHRVNTPNLIWTMKERSNFTKGLDGVYKGELQWGHIALFTPNYLKEVAEMIGYREVLFTRKNEGSSLFAEADFRPAADRDIVEGNIYADLLK